MTYVTPEAKAYKEQVGMMAKAAGVKPIVGRVAIVIEMYPHRPLDYLKRMKAHGDLWDDSVQCIDLGNAEKVLSDALKDVLFGDDKLLHDIHLKRMEPDGEARVVVTIRPYVRMVNPQADLLPTDAHGDLPKKRVPKVSAKAKSAPIASFASETTATIHKVLGVPSALLGDPF